MASYTYILCYLQRDYISYVTKHWRISSMGCDITHTQKHWTLHITSNKHWHKSTITNMHTQFYPLAVLNAYCRPNRTFKSWYLKIFLSIIGPKILNWWRRQWNIGVPYNKYTRAQSNQILKQHRSTFSYCKKLHWGPLHYKITRLMWTYFSTNHNAHYNQDLRRMILRP